MPDYALSDLVAKTVILATDLMHVRTIGNIDNKITAINLLNTILPLILTTKGDLIIQGTTDPERLAAGTLDQYLKAQGAGNIPIYEKLTLRDTGVKLGTTTRSTDGNQVISGVGFQPSLVIFGFIDNVETNLNWGVGFDTQSSFMCIYQNTNGTKVFHTISHSMRIFRNSSNFLYGKIDSMDADGFTIAWSLLGSVVLQYIYICLP